MQFTKHAFMYAQAGAFNTYILCCWWFNGYWDHSCEDATIESSSECGSFISTKHESNLASERVKVL